MMENIIYVNKITKQNVNIPERLKKCPSMCVR